MCAPGAPGPGGEVRGACAEPTVGEMGQGYAASGGVGMGGEGLWVVGTVPVTRALKGRGDGEV